MDNALKLIYFSPGSFSEHPPDWLGRARLPHTGVTLGISPPKSSTGGHPALGRGFFGVSLWGRLGQAGVGLSCCSLGHALSFWGESLLEPQGLWGHRGISGASGAAAALGCSLIPLPAVAAVPQGSPFPL